MICDHDTTKGVEAFKGILAGNRKSTDFILIPGVEVLTNQGEILGAFIEEMPSTLTFPEVAEEIREKGGIVIIPHPYDKFRRKAFRLANSNLKFIDAIEVYNSRCIMPKGNKKALKFAKENLLLKTAGSDAHFAVEIGHAGITFNGTTLGEFRKQLESGNTTYFGKSSPMITYPYIITHRLKRTFRRGGIH
jgi:predicted metal-dependent phosphoesterase TrpH